MSHACHRFWKCHKTLTFCSLLTRSTIPCACHAKAHLNVQMWSEPLVFLTFWLRNVLRAATACTFSTLQLPKVVRTWRFFVHLDFEMCFAPQRRALFRHRNFQKWSEPGVFWTFWLRNVLRATTACNFSSLIWPAGSAPAALASLLFDPPEPQIIGKNTVFRNFATFGATGSSFSWDFLFFDLSSLLFSSLLFSSLLFSSLLFFDSYHLCFSSVHTVGSLTSKLPSFIYCLYRFTVIYLCMIMYIINICIYIITYMYIYIYITIIYIIITIYIYT